MAIKIIFLATLTRASLFAIYRTATQGVWLAVEESRQAEGKRNS